MDQANRFLKEMGRRLRQARTQAGLSVSELARRVELSRRHLTEVEAGRANLSVLTLAALGRELHLGASALLPAFDGGRRDGRIALVGLRGAGKSTLGRRLALELEVPFVELDAVVEQLAGTGLSELFSTHGEAGYHRFEAEALEQVLASAGRCVVAAGGSIVTCEPNFARLKEGCTTVWLKAAPHEHYQRVVDQRDLRPMSNRPRAMAELEALLKAREPLYRTCDLALDTAARGVDECVAELARLVKDA
jgi:XRE family aerobic/anaerobic benzoate catabolism transcriptional regulator